MILIILCLPSCNKASCNKENIYNDIPKDKIYSIGDTAVEQNKKYEECYMKMKIEKATQAKAQEMVDEIAKLKNMNAGYELKLQKVKELEDQIKINQHEHGWTRFTKYCKP